MNSIYHSTIWDRSSASYARAPAKNSVSDTNRHEQKSSISLVADNYIGPKISAPTEKFKDGLDLKLVTKLPSPGPNKEKILDAKPADSNTVPLLSCPKHQKGRKTICQNYISFLKGEVQQRDQEKTILRRIFISGRN